MSPALRARSVLVALTTLCASVPLAAATASCGGGGGASTGAQTSDGGASDRGPRADAMISGDDATLDGTIALADASIGDAGDPCAADTGGTSGSTSLTAVWANEGGDKVTEDELRATGHATAVVNSVWDGLCIRTFGAKNEVVSFNVVLEAATSKATNVSVSLGDLTGPGGTVIRSAPRTTDKLFDWTTTEVELFYVRYLQIKGLSQQAYGTLASWQEATFPKRAQCPGMTQATPDSKPTGSGCPWTQRPVATKFLPDIAVPPRAGADLRHGGVDQPHVCCARHVASGRCVLCPNLTLKSARALPAFRFPRVGDSLQAGKPFRGDARRCQSGRPRRRRLWHQAG